METRKLTSEEIDQLTDFIQRKGVVYYDVLMELVDHFACAIENKWQTNPELSLEETFHAETKHFDRLEFDRIRNSKEKALQKKYLRLQLRYVQDFFNIPKILLTLVITIGLFAILNLSGNFLKTYVLIIFAFGFGFAIYYYLFFKRNYPNIELSQDKVFLLYKYYLTIRDRSVNVSGILYLAVTPINFINKQWLLTSPFLVYIQLGIAFVLTISGIITIATIVYLPQRIKADFINEYPQFVKA